MSTVNKDLSKKTQAILKSLGYEIKLSHAYELLARMAGHPSWNHASAENTDLTQALTPVVTPVVLNRIELERKQFGYNDESETVSTVDPNSPLKAFDVFLNRTNTEEKKYKIQAKDETEARAIMQQYADFRNESLYFDEITHEEVKKLIALEPESSFRSSRWIPCDLQIYEKVTVAEVYNGYK